MGETQGLTGRQISLDFYATEKDYKEIAEFFKVRRDEALCDLMG